MLAAMRCVCIIVAAVLSGGHVAGSASRVERVADSQPGEFLVIGIVVAAEPAASLITIRQPNLLGKLRIETKSYHVKQRGSLADLHSGDRITAIFSTKDGMLHRLTRVRSAKPAGGN